LPLVTGAQPRPRTSTSTSTSTPTSIWPSPGEPRMPAMDPDLLRRLREQGEGQIRGEGQIDKSGWNDRPRFAGRRLRHGSGRPVAQSYKRKEPVVRKPIRFVGLDVHAETIAVAVAEPGGEVRSLGTIPNEPEAVRRNGGAEQPATGRPAERRIF